MLFVGSYFAAAATSGHLLSCRLVQGAGPAGRIASALTLWMVFLVVPVQWTAWLEIVGAIERIEPVWLIGFQIAILAGAWLLRKRDQGRRLGPDLASFLLILRQAPLYLRLALAAVGGAYGLAAVKLAFGYPLGYDALSYHLPMALRWFQDRSLAIGPKTDWHFSLPANTEITAFIAFFSGDESLLPVVQAIALAALLVSAYALALRLSHSRKAALGVAIILLTLPIVFFQAFSAYVDLYGAGCLLTAAYLARLWMDRREGNQGLLAVSAMACGLAMGAKPTLWVFGLVYVGVMAAWTLRNRRSRTLPIAAIVAAGILLPSWFWPARGWLQTGNPAYPIEVRLGDMILFPGTPPELITRPNWVLGRFVRHPAEWAVYPWVEYKSLADLTAYSAEAGAGAAFAVFVPLGLAVGLYLAVTRRGSEWRGWWVLWAALALLWWFPLQQLPRFGLPWVALSVVLASRCLALLDRIDRRTFAPLFVTAVGLASLLLAMDPALSMAAITRDGRWSRSGFYTYPAAIDKLPTGSVIANTAGHENYPLAGAGLKHHVVLHFETRRWKRGAPPPQPVDYVVDIADDPANDPPPFAGLALEQVDDVPLSGNGPSRFWRIWRVVER